MQRVAKAFQAAKNGDGVIKIRLSPPELGSLRIELKLDGANMIAKVETETAAARQALVDNLSTLRERLTELDVSIESFDVDVADRQMQPREDREDADTNRDSQRNNDGLAADETGESKSDSLNARQIQEIDRLNVIV